MIESSKALVLLAPGFEEIESASIVDILRRCGIEVTIAGLRRDVVESSHGVKWIPDKFIEEVDARDFDALICPGGSPGWENLRKDRRVLELVRKAYEAGKIVTAICGSPAVLTDAGILKGKSCTIYPGMEGELRKGGEKPKKGLVVSDGNVITSMGPATAIAFALEVAGRLANKRIVREVSKSMLADIGAKLR